MDSQSLFKRETRQNKEASSKKALLSFLISTLLTFCMNWLRFFLRRSLLCCKMMTKKTRLTLLRVSLRRLRNGENLTRRPPWNNLICSVTFFKFPYPKTSWTISVRNTNKGDWGSKRGTRCWRSRRAINSRKKHKKSLRNFNWKSQVQPDLRLTKKTLGLLLNILKKTKKAKKKLYLTGLHRKLREMKINKTSQFIWRNSIRRQRCSQTWSSKIAFLDSLFCNFGLSGNY